MPFAHPHALWLLLLVPLVWFARRQEPLSRVPVATLHFWKEMQRTEASSPSRRLRWHWLAIVQAACLVSMILAMAKPTLTFGERTVSIVIDTSLSMSARLGDGTRLDEAIRRATATLDELPRGTRVRIVEAGSVPRDLGEHAASDAGARDSLRELRVTDAGADLSGAIERARHTGTEVERLYVFTDAPAPAVRGGSGRDLEWVAVGQPAGNLAITRLAYRRRENATTIDVLTELRNFGSNAVHADLSIEPEGAGAVRERFDIAAMGTVSMLTTIADYAGVLTARIDGVRSASPGDGRAVDVDAIAADDVRRVVIDPARTLRVRIVGPDGATSSSGPGYFLRTALAAHPHVALVGRDGAADIEICGGCEEVPEGVVGVWIIGGRAEAFDSAQAKAFDVAQAKNAGHYVRTKAGRDVPAGRHVEYELHGRRIVEWGFDPESGSLPLSAEFPVLVAQAIEWLDVRSANASSIDAGAPLTWMVPDAGTVDDVEIAGSDGRSERASVSDGTMLFTSTSSAGVYRVRLAGGDRTFVVNPAASGESDLSSPAPPPAGQTAPAAPVTTPRDSAASLLIVCALIFLAVEWHYRRYRRWPLQGRA